MFKNVWVVQLHHPTSVEVIVFDDEVKANDFWEIMNATSLRDVSIDKAILVS